MLNLLRLIILASQVNGIIISSENKLSPKYKIEKKLTFD